MSPLFCYTSLLVNLGKVEACLETGLLAREQSWFPGKKGMRPLRRESSAMARPA